MRSSEGEGGSWIFAEMRKFRVASVVLNVARVTFSGSGLSAYPRMDDMLCQLTSSEEEDRES